MKKEQKATQNNTPQTTSKSAAESFTKTLLLTSRPNYLLGMLITFLMFIPEGFYHLQWAIQLEVQQNGATLDQQSLFSLYALGSLARFVVMPFIDTYYIKKIGRSKTYVLIFGSISATILLLLSLDSDSDIKNLKIRKLTGYWFCMAVSDSVFISAANSWLVTMFEDKYKEKAGTARYFGIGVGMILTYNVYIPLRSKEFMNNHFFKEKPLTAPLVSSNALIFSFAVTYYLILAMLALFVPELRLDNENSQKSITAKYQHLQKNEANSQTLETPSEANQALSTQPQPQKMGIIAVFKQLLKNRFWLILYGYLITAAAVSYLGISVQNMTMIKSGLKPVTMSSADTFSKIPAMLIAYFFNKAVERGRLMQLYHFTFTLYFTSYIARSFLIAELVSSKGESFTRYFYVLVGAQSLLFQAARLDSIYSVGYMNIIVEKEFAGALMICFTAARYISGHSSISLGFKIASFLGYGFFQRVWFFLLFCFSLGGFFVAKGLDMVDPEMFKLGPKRRGLGKGGADFGFGSTISMDSMSEDDEGKK